MLIVRMDLGEPDLQWPVFRDDAVVASKMTRSFRLTALIIKRR